ncbi:hypothetical protein HK101_003716, partial [Irineochytrium annulatum]
MSVGNSEHRGWTSWFRRPKNDASAASAGYPGGGGDGGSYGYYGGGGRATTPMEDAASVYSGNTSGAEDAGGEKEKEPGRGRRWRLFGGRNKKDGDADDIRSK